MQIASHLTTSRHNVFYFRFPIPQNLHPQGKQSDVRLSLQTRCPREALHISHVLSYVGDQLLKQVKTLGMEYQAIKDVLQEHFKGVLERRREKLALTPNAQEMPALANKSGGINGG